VNNAASGRIYSGGSLTIPRYETAFRAYMQLRFLDMLEARSTAPPFRQRTLGPYPPSQFCWLRLLAGLLYIPKWRGSKETAVFAGEL
jgi:hypothetical protein